ncbi:uncharacterized protein LOC133531320 [Cydia pomonella]|uniref:uncharacterized protein LOC133531320 n=1 Tax=Cydia pomonella TaxID=82600 RepID=UPI002ADE78D9|nr:uncharacterized protein LOC133531320 [Cydia pomonella]
MNMISQIMPVECDPDSPRRHKLIGTCDVKYIIDEDPKEEKKKSTPGIKLIRRKEDCLKIATWNIRSVIKPGKLDNVILEMGRLHLDILGLSEVRWKDNGKYEKQGSVLYYSGKPSTDKDHYHGVVSITPIKIQDIELEMVDEIKYLGVTLDRTLRYRTHIKEQSAKAIRTLYQCKRAVGKNWGLKPGMIYWIYKAVILPRVLYGAVVWWHRAHIKEYQRDLTKVQRLACLMMTGAMRTTPTHAMEVMLGLKPLWIEVEKRATEQWYRMKACKEWRGSCVDKRHALIQREALSRFEMLMANNDLIKRQEIFDKKYRVHIGERDNWKVEVRHPTTICFTDGSRRSSTKLAGAGIVIPKLGETVSISLGRYASVFQAEVCAIAHCARIIKESVKQEGAVVIYTDSQAALKALKKISVTSALVRECREELNSIGEQRRVTVAWVPGHQGVTGNERADELARIGAETEYMGPEPALPMSADVTKGVIEKVKELEAQREWEEETSCRQSKMMVKGIDHKRTRYLLKLVHRLIAQAQPNCDTEGVSI